MRTVAGLLAVALLGAASPVLADFDHAYSPAFWSVTLTGTPAGGGAPVGVDTSAVPGALTLIGGDGVAPGGQDCWNDNLPVPRKGCAIYYSIVVPASGVVSFSWSYHTDDNSNSAEFDIFGYRVGGISTQLTNPTGTVDQSGTVSVPVQAGQWFGFWIDCGDCGYGGATVVIQQFSAPPPEVQLTFNPVTPCRLVDTRIAIGPLSPRSAGAYSASDPARIAQAGGSATGCGIPAGASALMLTVTAIGPAQNGNIVAYPSGQPVPLASALNFLPSQIVANTTIVPTTPGSGDNFSLFNNSDGQTQLVVDVAGYFWEYVASDCAVTRQSSPVSVGASPTVGARCTTGYVATGGGCSASTAGAVVWLNRLADADGLGYACRGLNRSAGAITVNADAMCCRRAGR